MISGELLFEIQQEVTPFSISTGLGTDPQQECYRLLSDKGDVDREQRLAEWERFYNFDRPHGTFADQTPYEALRERLQ